MPSLVPVLVPVLAPVLVLAQLGPLLRLKRLQQSACVLLLLLLVSGARRTKKTWPVTFPKEQLKERLTPMQYHVTQERGTESAFTGELTFHKDEGTYNCVVCGAPLFSSKTKFDSGSGWPSFYDLISKDSIDQTDDFSYGLHRVETNCAQCGAHLGHVFDDGPKPTRKRYCINSASLAFKSDTETKPELNQDSETPKTQPELNQDSETPKTQPELNQDSETPKTTPGSKTEL